MADSFVAKKEPKVLHWRLFAIMLTLSWTFSQDLGASRQTNIPRPC